MIRGALPLAALLALPVARAEEEPLEIVVVKRAGIEAHAEVAEEFADRCRVRARMVNIDEVRPESLRAQLKRSDVVVAVGQRALDAVVGSRAHVVSALAPATPRGVITADAPPLPELTLRALKAARPSIRRVGVLVGMRAGALERSIVEAAKQLGLTLLLARAADGPHAVVELRRIGGTVDALWLAPDLDVLTGQVFEYALSLEIQRAIPLAAVTRQQVKTGALLAIDADPHAVGRQAAEIVNRLLAGEDARTLADSGQTGSLELTVNADVARRLGVDTAALVALGARIE